MNNCKLTASIAAESAPQVGLDPLSIITIITGLLPILGKALSACTPASTPGEYRNFVSSKYDGSEYGAGVLNRTIREVRQQSARAGTRLHRADAETLAVQTLDGIRTATDDDLQEAISAAGL